MGKLMQFHGFEFEDVLQEQQPESFQNNFSGNLWSTESNETVFETGAFPAEENLDSWSAPAVLELELQGSEWQEAGRLNHQLMQDTSLRWGRYAQQILSLLERFSTGPIFSNGRIDPMRFVAAVDSYQVAKGLKPTNKGVIAIGTWSQLQDDLGFFKIDKSIPVNLTDAIVKNRGYSNSLWAAFLPQILQYFTTLGLMRDGLPVDMKYLSWLIATWQRHHAKSNLVADGILGPKSWAVLKPLISTVKPPVPAPAVVHPPTKWRKLFPEAKVCYAEPLVYGLQAFSVMAEAIKSANRSQHFIYIAGWMLEADFKLIPEEEDSTLLKLLSKAATNQVEIRILIWDNPYYKKEIEAARRALSGFNAVKFYIDDQTLGSAIVESALSELRSAIAKVPDFIKTELEDNKQWQKINAFKDQTNEGSHHEKILIVNGDQGLTAFCGGIDLNRDRIGHFTQCPGGQHKNCLSNYKRPSETKYLPVPDFYMDNGIPKVREILHDVHCQVKGHAAWKLLERFKQRWNQFLASNPVLTDTLSGQHLAAPGEDSIDDPQTSYVKIIHTFNQRNPTRFDSQYGTKVDRSIWTSIKSAINSAEKSIHIEDQYMVSVEVARLLNARMKHPDFKGGTISFLTQDDEFAGDDIPIIKRMRREFMHTLYSGLTQEQLNRVTLYMLNPGLPFPAHHKVHSKIYIIDRELVIIGSANCSRRSLTNDTETAAIIYGPASRSTQFVERLERRYDGISRWIRYEPNNNVVDIEVKLIQSLNNYIVKNPTKAIILGGAVMVQPHLLTTVFLALPEIVRNIVDPYNVPPGMMLSPEVSEEILRIESPFLSNEANFDNYDAEGIFIQNARNEHLHENFDRLKRDTVESIEPEYHFESEPESYNVNEWNETTNDFEGQEAVHDHDHEHLTDAYFDEETGLSRDNHTPELLGDDLSVPGYTCYVKIDIGKGNIPLQKTGIYVPSTFQPDQPADILVYLHGMTSYYPGPNAEIDTYWSSSKLPAFDLRIREDINASSRNIILVAPTLGKSPNSYRNRITGTKGGFDWYMDLVNTAIREHIFNKRFTGKTLQIRNIILSAHSAGGRQMTMIAMGENPEHGFKISECWGLDSLYSHVYSWLEWAAKNPAKKLFVYFQSSTRENALRLSTKAKQLPNIIIQKSNAKNHFWVVKAHLPERLINAGSPAIPKQLQEATFLTENLNAVYSGHQPQYELVEFTDETEADYHQPGEISSIPEYQEFLEQLDALVQDWSRAITLNRSYATSLGWNKYHQQINDLLLPYAGMQNVSLGEEAFAQAVAAWQARQGLSGKQADGIIGPNTWKLMSPYVVQAQTTQPTYPVQPGHSNTGMVHSSAQSEWSSSPIIQRRYPDIARYEAARTKVTSWGISTPATYIETAIQEWEANPGIHIHFNRNFDGDPHHSYLNLKRLYSAKGIQAPADYFTANIVQIRFFNRTTPGHRDLSAALSRAQASLTAAGINYTLASAWSFVPRTFNSDINKLSNHAMGRAIDINPSTNPHIISSKEVLVINSVCGAVLPNGLLAESNPDVLSRASQFFKQNYTDAWIARQTQPAIVSAITSASRNLRRYATNGFFDLPTPLVMHLQNAGLRWGGAWRTAKDFMHFELP